ncbi:hypothetical protein [Nocardioides sp. SR21]|uniref:hypothetical protein n=1 Tax=Nocardioides sp. SR21 TaxID=2919501 RepID=UPI001FA958A8|nr:hypothetical protein [Nocardioides sp. SR21]
MSRPLSRTAVASLATAALATTLLAGALPAEATPTWVKNSSISKAGALPTDATVAVADDGTAVAAWVREVGSDLRVQVASAYSGVWGKVSTVSDAGKDAAAPSVAINDDGDAVVTWLQPDLNDDLRLAASRRLTSSTWDGRALISPLGATVDGAADLALSGDGRLHAAYVAVGGADLRMVEVTTWDDDGSEAESKLLSGSDDGFGPAIDVNESGAGLVSFQDDEGPDADNVIRVSRLAAGATSWQDAVEVSEGVHGLETDVAVSDSGFGQVAFTRSWEGDHRLEAVKVQPNGNTGNPSFVSPANTDAGDPSIDMNADGDALVAWRSTIDGTNGIGYASSKPVGDWVPGALKVGVFSPTSPTAMTSDTGVTMIAYGGSGRLLASYRTRSIVPFTPFDSGDQNFVSGSAVAGMDDQGNALLAGVLPDELVGAFLDIAGPTIETKAPATALGKSYELTWSGLDRFSAVVDSDVVVRQAAWNGTFGDPKQLASDTDEHTLGLGIAPGRTSCASVQMRDTVGNLSMWSQRCTTAPVDDRTLKATTGFVKAKGKGHYRGTVVTTVDKNARLTLTGAKAKRIALVVAKSPNAGSVRVSFAGQDLGVFSLKGTGKKKVVPVKTFGAVKSGKLVITVVSPDGRPVVIDGVVIAK